MTIPKPILAAWHWLAHVHTAHWLTTAVVESGIVGTFITWGANAYHSIPLFLAMVYGLFGAACAMLITVAAKQLSGPSISLPPLDEKRKVQMVSSLPPLAPIATGRIEPKRYAQPSDTKDIDIQKTTNKSLGSLLVSLANEARKIIDDNQQTSTARMIADFNRKTAAHFLWAYEEARNRGHRDGDLDRYFDDMATVNVFTLEKKLRMLGSRLHLYIDPT